MKKINSFASACTKLGVDINQLPEVGNLPETERKPLIAHYKLMIIAKALNEGWAPDWKNTDERKWFPYFDMDHDSTSGFGFSLSFYVSWYSNTDCGSRLCFKSEELSDYAGSTFTELYKDLLTLEN
jgi:hypothetical protein